MSGVFTVSCIQFTSARDYEPNIRVVSDLVRRARDGGADFVMTPENTGLTEPVGKLRREKASPIPESTLSKNRRGATR